jgi:hypothetical protein
LLGDALVGDVAHTGNDIFERDGNDSRGAQSIATSAQGRESTAGLALEDFAILRGRPGPDWPPADPANAARNPEPGPDFGKLRGREQFLYGNPVAWRLHVVGNGNVYPSEQFKQGHNPGL